MSKLPDSYLAKFEALRSRTNHSFHLDLARKLSALTIPALYPKSGKSNSSAKLVYPMNGVLPKATKSLASNLCETTYPSNGVGFFSFEPSEVAMADIADKLKAIGQQAIDQGEDATAITKMLNDYLSEIRVKTASEEKKISTDLAASTMRSQYEHGMELTIVGGECLIELISVDPIKIKVHNLVNYARLVDGSGTPLKTIIRESIAFESLAPKVQKAVAANFTEKGIKKQDFEESDITIYTECVLKGNFYEVNKYIDEVKLPGTYAKYPKDKCVYIPLVLKQIEGEHYGRPFQEDYAGTMVSAEEMQRAIRAVCAMAAKYFIMVNPGSTSLSAVEQVKVGGVIAGRESDVALMQFSKGLDMSFLTNEKTSLEAIINEAHMVQVFRKGERVTAEEIQMQANALNKLNGGLYNKLSDSFQKKFINAVIGMYERAGKFKLPQDVIGIRVLTGLDAIGKGMDAQRLIGFIQQIQVLAGPEAAAYINKDQLITRLAVASGIDPVGLIKSKEEQKADQLAAQQAQMAQAAAPAMMGSAFQGAAGQQPVQGA